MAPRWKAAKHALVLMMRSWVGIVLITSEDMGLPTLVRMLQDPKVPVPTQEVILEAFGEVLAPVSAKVNYVNRSRQQQLQTSFLQDQKLTSHSSSSQLNTMSSAPSGLLLIINSLLFVHICDCRWQYQADSFQFRLPAGQTKLRQHVWRCYQWFQCSCFCCQPSGGEAPEGSSQSLLLVLRQLVWNSQPSCQSAAFHCAYHQQLRQQQLSFWSG